MAFGIKCKTFSMEREAIPGLVLRAPAWVSLGPEPGPLQISAWNAIRTLSTPTLSPEAASSSLPLLFLSPTRQSASITALYVFLVD